MKQVYWQKLILRGFGPFEQEVDLDFREGINLLISGNESGKSSLVLGLAATLFGLDPQGESRHTLERYHNWQNPERCEGELFFLAEGQNYHLQRIFSSDRVRLRCWRNSAWQLLYDGFDHRHSSLSPGSFREQLQRLLGLHNLSAFLETFCVSQFEASGFDLSDELQELLSGGIRYPEARRYLQAEIAKRHGGECDSAETPSEQERLQQELRLLEQERQASLHLEEQLIALHEELEELQQRRPRQRRQQKRHEELQEPLRQWQLHSDRMLILSGRQAELEQAQRNIEELEAERDRAQAELDTLCVELGTDPQSMAKQLRQLRERQAVLQAAEEEYLKTERALQRYGPLPLSTAELLPIIDRRLELLQLQNQQQQQRPPRYLSGAQAMLAATILAVIAAVCFYSFWAQHQQIAGLFLTALLALATAFIAYRLLPQEPGIGAAARDPISQELQRQALDLGGLALMDAIALQAFRQQIVLVEAQRLKRPDREELRAVRDALAEQNDRSGNYRQLYQAWEERQRLWQQALQNHRLLSTADLKQQQQNTAQQLNQEFTLWRRLAQRYPELPEPRPQDVDTARQQFRQLQEDQQRLLREAEQDEQRQGALQRQIVQLENQPTANIARLEEAIAAKRARLVRLEAELQALHSALGWLDAAVADFSRLYRQQLCQRIAGYFEFISGPRQQRLALNDQFRLQLFREEEEIQLFQLSQGAQDQLRFALRLSLADHLSNECLLPLILDDPFVNCDKERREKLAEILHTLARQRQIWLLSHDEAYADWGYRQQIAPRS